MICVWAAEAEHTKMCAWFERYLLSDLCALVTEYCATKYQLFEEDLTQRYWLPFATVGANPGIRHAQYEELQQLAAQGQPLIQNYLLNLLRWVYGEDGSHNFTCALIESPGACNRLSCYYDRRPIYAAGYERFRCKCSRPILPTN